MKKKFVLQYNKRTIMLNAHEFFRDGRYGTFGECLKKAWENAKQVKAFTEKLGKEVHTWYGWTLLGREVIHGEMTIGQLELWRPFKNKVKGIISYFTYEQTCELGTQAPKEV